MATDYLTTLHPYKDRKKKNAFPNVKDENIPSTIQRKLSAGDNISIADDNVISSSYDYKYTLNIVYDYENMKVVSAGFLGGKTPNNSSDINKIRVTFISKDNENFKGNSSAFIFTFGTNKSTPTEHRLGINISSYSKPSSGHGYRKAHETSYYFTYDESVGEIKNISLNNDYEYFDLNTYWYYSANLFVNTDTIKYSFDDSTKKVEFHLDNTILNKINKSLQLPGSATDEMELVGFNKSGQQNINVGNLLTISNNILDGNSNNLFYKEAVIDSTSYEIDTKNYNTLYFIYSYYEPKGFTIIVGEEEHTIPESVLTTLIVKPWGIYMHTKNGEFYKFDYNEKIKISVGQSNVILIMAIKV